MKEREMALLPSRKKPRQGVSSVRPGVWMSHNFYRDDFSDYTLNPYADDTYNFAAAQALMAYSSYEFEEPDFIDYGAYDHVQSEPVIAYSASFFSEPKVIEYDPTTHYIDGYYNLSQTRYIVSYSTVEFNEDDDVDYDSTPYGGGYDPILTYGKPLSPSNEICYPRSPALDDSRTPSKDVSSNGLLLALPSGKEEVEEKLEKPQVEEANKGHDNVIDEKGKASAAEKDDPKEGNFIDYRPIWSDYENGYGIGRSEEEYSYEYDKQVPQIPCGYGSDKAVDLCESIFGYWPSLSKKDDKSYGFQGIDHGDRNNLNQWKGTADYLFGSSNSCGEWRVEAGMYDSPIFGYERHYQEPLQHCQIDYVEHIYDCRISEN